MRKLLRIIHLLFLLIFYKSAVTFGQGHVMGFDFGFGQSTTEDILPIMVSPLKGGDTKFMNLGLGYYFQPGNVRFRMKSGLSFDQRQLDNEFTLNYLKVPVCFDYILGNRIKPYFGTGFFVSYLFYSENENNTFKDNKNRFQVGFIVNFGLEFDISHNVLFDIGYQLNSDLTDMYSHTNPTLSYPQGLREVRVYGFDKYFRVGIKFKLNTE